MAQTILITGSSSGIGKATAIYFAEQGWNVVATMRTPEKAGDWAKHSNITLTRLDVLELDSIQQAVNDTISKFSKIDAVVNNAGYGLVGPFEASNNEQIQRQFDTNVFGLMNVCREIIPHFREQRGGTIINVASLGGRVTFPLYSLYHGTNGRSKVFLNRSNSNCSPSTSASKSSNLARSKQIFMIVRWT